MSAKNFKLIILILILLIFISFASLFAYVYVTRVILKTVPTELSNGFSKFIDSNAPIIESSSTDKVEWAKAMLVKFPYNKKLHAGILAGKKPGEVWIVGKGGLDVSDPKNFLE